MSYCKYCQDVLEIVKNNNYDPNTIDLTIDGLIGILNNHLNAKKGKYVNETAYQIKFAPEELDTIELDMNKFKNMSDENVRLELHNLYEDIIKGNRNANMFNFQCSSCAMTYYLQPGTVISTNNFVETSYIVDEAPEIRVHDPTLFRTKDFICVKKTCITNTDKSDKIQREKEAVFYKLGTTHNIKYICTHCNTRWGT